MKNIIVPTDFSKNAANAMHYAAALAQAAKARLVLYHAFPYPVISTDVPVEIQSYIDEMTENHVEKLIKLRHSLEEKYPIDINCIAQAGSVAYNLQDIMQREKGDLAVMGLRGANPALNVLMGSTTFEVLRQGKTPLLIVPQGAAFRTPKHILFACDDPYIENASVVGPLKDIAALFGAEIEVYMVNPPQLIPSPAKTPRNSNLERHFDKLKHIYTFDQAEGVRESILKGIGESKADILTMIPRHRSVWSYLFGKSDTQSIALQTTIPMLALAENGNTRS